MNSEGGIVIALLECASQVRHVLNGVRLEQVLVVEVIKEDVQAALGVINLCLECRRGPGLDALHVRRQNLEDGLCVCRNV